MQMVRGNFCWIKIGCMFWVGWLMIVCFETIHTARAFCVLPQNPRTQPRTLLHVKEPTTVEATDIRIRDSLYGELGDVADVIIDSFYAQAKPPWSHMYRLAELNRIQQGFPYADKELHRMLVAVTKDSNGKDNIVGFCDIDARTPNRPTSYKFNPRPYLSDLCVTPFSRRRGIARSLISECEEFSKNLGKTDLYIRVERQNEAAVKMYNCLGYSEMENDLDDSKKILILRKSLAV